MSIQFYLQTRGKTIDYRFLYETPSSEWWRYYADYTLFEDETIILERLAGGECRLYLSGIPSNRRDRVNTIIRYTLVAEFDKDEGREILSLVEIFIADCRKDSSNVLGDKLDSCFSKEYIEDALRYTERDGQKRQNEINKKIISLELIPQSNLDDQYVEGICWGGLASNNSWKAWLSLASRILINGELGVVALLNAASEKSLSSLKERLLEKQINNAFILLSDSDEPPQSVKDKEIKNSEDIFKKPLELAGKGLSSLGELGKDLLSSLRTRIYIGVGVLFSAFIFLVFMLAR